MRRIPLIITSVLAVTALAGAASPASAAAATTPSLVSVVHGLRGLVADISIDGKVALAGFGAERSTDPMPVPAGPHQVEVRRSGDTGPAVISTTLTVPSGANISLVAHLDPSGKPVLSPFVNDQAAVPAGKGRLVARNTSASVAVDFLVDGQPRGGDTASSAGAPQTDLAPGPHTVAVQAPAGGPELLGAQTVQVPAGQTTAMYLIGSPTDGSLGWLVQTVKIVAATPGGVPTGNSGLKDRSGYHPSAASSTDTLAGGLLLFAFLSAAGSRRRRSW